MDGFLEKCDEAKKFALAMDNPLIVHHYDADGVSAGALVCSAFEGKKYRRKCIKKLDDHAIEELTQEKEIIFVDLGGGNKRVNELQNVLIIDHHQTEGIEKFQINPLLFGLDGGKELCSASTAYCVFRKHADLAVVGAAGDMQMPLSGMNKWVAEQGVESGEIVIEQDLRFYGRYCRNLIQFLAYSDDPYLPGISYREDKAEELLKDLGLNYENRIYADLNDEEKKTLISALARILIGTNRKTDLVGESYIFPKRPKNETYEANEFSTILNACGRHSKPDIGVRVCLGDESAYQEARELLRLHRKMLRDGINYASKNIQNLGNFYFLDGREIIDEGIIGIVIGMSLRGKKPIIGVSLGEEGSIKISGRCPKTSEKNMGALMKAATEELGGVGGGHTMAAGAAIPIDKLNEFLLFCGNYLK